MRNCRHLNLRNARPPPPERQLLLHMIGRLRHRGPDEYGLIVTPGRGSAHARLSIIDLSTGQQPLTNEDGRLWIVFNGEIFNYVELRKDLEAAGHRFRTHSDTEVIVHAYEQWGNDCFGSVQRSVGGRRSGMRRTGCLSWPATGSAFVRCMCTREAGAFDSRAKSRRSLRTRPLPARSMPAALTRLHLLGAGRADDRVRRGRGNSSGLGAARTKSNGTYRDRVYWYPRTAAARHGSRQPDRGDGASGEA